jgi:hypothetical protein
MAQKFTEVRIPFAKMSFTPDVPATALSANEYNAGLNVETDVRGIRSTSGDASILQSVPGTPTFVTGGFRQSGEFWFIAATVEGQWWASNGQVNWYDITPGGVPIVGYAQNTNITESWNGTVVFFNDTVGAPMFLPDTPGATLIRYSNNVPVVDIEDSPSGIQYVNATTQRITLADTQAAPLYAAGEQILISGVAGAYYNGTYIVVSSTTTTIDYLAVPGAAYPGQADPDEPAQVSPQYTWNYNPNWSSVIANFMRLYNTPNVGSILVAGNLTATNIDTTQELYPVSVRWSQAFGLNQAPLTWVPTVINVANELEVPLRGPALDAFPSNGQFFLCSYWDTVVFSPINYSTTSAPILGVRLYNQGRGLLSSNCWANTDQMVYGIDARDVWVFDGNNFQGIGNQRVKNWFYDQLAPEYYDRVFMEVNSQKNQIEIYYPDSAAVGGVPNKMLSYRYDLDVWNAPRDVTSATFACESPIWRNYANPGNPPDWRPALGSRTVVYARGQTGVPLVQKDQGFSFITSNANPTGAIASSFRRDNIKLLPDYSGHLLVHRVLPETVNLDGRGIPLSPVAGNVTASTGNITVQISGSNSVGSNPTAKPAVTIPIATDNPWVQVNQNAFRVNAIEITNTSNADIWMCNATTWQYTQTQDDR